MVNPDPGWRKLAQDGLIASNQLASDLTWLGWLKLSLAGHGPDPGRARALADLAGSVRILVWFRSVPGPDWPKLQACMAFALPWLGLPSLAWPDLTWLWSDLAFAGHTGLCCPRHTAAIP